MAVLLQTKLYPPPARADRIARPRLIARLDEGIRHGCKLTLLCAPAGAGKTTLVSQWLTSRSYELKVKSEELNQPESTLHSQLSTLNYGVAWLSLDAADNDPAQFWSYVIAAIETVQPGAGAAAQAALAMPQPPPLTTILAQYINALAERAPQAPPIVLILDDYHAIEAPAIHTTLLFLIEHLPPQLRLVIASRADPPLPLARMRVRGDLAELRAADLGFTPGEAATFLTDIMDLSLSAADVAALAARTEGWSAGLHLAALALRERTDPGEFIAAFAGSNRFVIDYLLEEVFSRQPPHIQTFLLQTAILDRLCGSLCDAVLGLSTGDGVDIQLNAPTTTPVGRGVQLNAPATTTDSFSQRILDELERRNLFIVPLDDQRQWYRYHHLFAEVLRTRLRSGAMSAEVAGLHRRASSWYARHDLLPEAVQHALALPDAELAAGLIEQGGLRIAGRGQGYTVGGWLRALPETLIRARPMLCFIDAITLMNSNQLEAAAARLADTERCLTAAPDDQRELILGQVMLVRANLARLAGDAPASVVQAEQALALLPGTQPMLRAVAALIMARAYVMSGDVTPASEQRLREAVAVTREAGNAVAHLTGLVHIGRMQCLQGRLREAGATYAAVRQMLAGAGPLSNQAGAAALMLCEGDWLRERNELDVAEQRLAQGMDAVQGPIGIDADFLLLGIQNRTQALLRARELELL